jgi:hypothetical protein
MIRIALALAGCIALTGCGLITLTHDSLIGPVSPAGRIHDLTVGSDFHVTDEGPVVESGGNALLRPYPLDLFRRIAEPSSFWSLAQGIEAFLTSISPVATRSTRFGHEFSGATRAELLPGTAVGNVLALLGPPEVWLQRSSGSVMLYRQSEQTSWSLYLGIPPPAQVLIPIPGIANLRFRYVSDQERASKLLLFFDAQDLLVAVSANADASGGEPQ